MDNIKETKIVLCFNHYNGDYHVGSVYEDFYLLDVKESLNNGWGWANFKIINTFCATSFNANNMLAEFSISIPTPVRPEGIKKFNEIVGKIKGNSEYMEKQEDNLLKRLEFVDVKIDKNKYTINKEDSIISELLTAVIDYQKIKKFSEEYMDNICKQPRDMELAALKSNSRLDIPLELRSLNNDSLLFDKVWQEIEDFTQ